MTGTTWWSALTLCLLLSGFLAAGELDPARWQFTGPNAANLKKAVDNDLNTWWESDGPQVPGMAVVIDLGQSAYVYRVFLTAGAEVAKTPRSLNVYVGESLENLQVVARERSLAQEDKTFSAWESPALRNESCLRFAPTKGRFIKLEIGPNGAGLPWAIAELDVHAATQDVAEAKRLAVVVDTAFIRAKEANQPVPFSPLKMAAEDLQYYLMELTDAPVSILTPEEAANRQGLRFRLVLPPPEQVPAPEPDPKNLDDVSVTREGDEIRIGGPTPRAVLFSAYEFLYRQGVRWLYPGAHGDVVPARKTLDLAVLPIAYRPPFSARGFMAGDLAEFGHDEYWAFMMRQRFTMGYNYTGCPLGTIPRFNCGFGWAHTMGGLFGKAKETDKSLEELHPDWWPGPYRKGWYKVPCTSNPEVLEYIRAKIEAEIANRAKNKLPPLQGFGVHPNDSPSFCECPRCEQLFGKPTRLDPDGAEESNGTWNYADHHFYLINELAKRLHQDHPELFLKTLAYANHERPPQKIEKLPGNVFVDICPWWSPLPVDAPQNVGIRDNLKAWQSRCGSLGIWSYVLIYSDTTFGYPAGEKNLVIPNARAIVNQNRFYYDLGMRLVSTQVMGPQTHWPWGFYAFARTTWQPEEKAEVILRDFFRGYYGEAWEPMLKWYETLERSALEQNLDTSVPDARLIGPETIGTLRQLLTAAEQKARRWYEKERVAVARYDTEWTATRGQWQTKTDRPYPCYRFAQPPVIDGNLDDVAWQTAPELAGFRLAATRIDDQRPGRFAMQCPTRFRMGWDQQFLYLGIVCQEPEIEQTKATDAKQTKFEYQNLVEIFLAPDAPPYYRQTLVSSAGHIWGPLKIRQVNAHQVMQDPDFLCKTAYTPDGWTLEARFPTAMIAAAVPREGTCWPANLVRVVNRDQGLGEKFSSWSDLPRYHFHQYSLGTWSLIQFRDTALTPQDAAALSTQLNVPFTKAQQTYAEHQQQVAAFAAKVEGKADLAAPAPDRNVSLLGLNEAPRRSFEVGWAKGPVTFDAVRITWTGRQMYRRWYSLEYWDGERYRLIEERRNNEFEVSLHEFPPVTASRLRLTVWGDLEGWRQQGMLKAFSVYQR